MATPGTDRRAALRWAIAFTAGFLVAATAHAAGALPVTARKLNLPSRDFADLPTLFPEIDYSGDNDLRSLSFACDGDLFFALITAPGFSVEPAQDGKLTLGDGGPSLTLAFRDLYGAPGADAPKLDWDATVLYAPVEAEDLSQMAPLGALILSLGDHRWRLPLPGFGKALPVFLEYCATGQVSDRSVVAR